MQAPKVPTVEHLQPLVLSYGMGVDSTAILAGWLQRGIRPDLILFADVGNEKEATYAYLAPVNAWLRAVGFPEVTVVKYRPDPKRCKFGAYESLGMGSIRLATLPSLAFGRKGCSLKWKVRPMDKFVRAWAPAKAAWEAGLKVRRVIGYDCGSADSTRFAHASTKKADVKFEYVYPLREWGWDREECMRQILAVGLPVPVKSACWFCPASKPEELGQLTKPQLKHIVIMETRAKPSLKTCQGLWRSATKARPGSMTEYIRSERLLEPSEVERLQSSCPMGKALPAGILERFLATEMEGAAA